MTLDDFKTLNATAVAEDIASGVSPELLPYFQVLWIREVALQLAELNESIAILKTAGPLVAGIVARLANAFPVPQNPVTMGKGAQCDNCPNVFIDGDAPAKFPDMAQLIDGVRAGGWRVLVKVIEENGPQKGHLDVLMFCTAAECQQVGESLYVDGWENGAALDLGKRLRKRSEGGA